MKILLKTLATILLMALVSAAASGLTFLLFKEWQIGFRITLMFYGGIGVLFIFGLIMMLFEYVFGKS